MDPNVLPLRALPRNEHELVAQSYMVGNCAHCHNPRGFPTVNNPVLASKLDFLPSATGGVFQFDMTLTSPHCPVGDQLKARVNDVLIKQKGVSSVDVKLTFEPPWSKEKLTFEGKLQASMLGIM